MRKVVLPVAALAVVALVAYLALRHKDSPSDPAAGTTKANGSAAVRAPEAPSFAGTADPKDPQAMQKFEQRKLAATAHLHEDLDRRLRSCTTGAGSAGSALPAPRLVMLDLEWDAALSTPELQRYTVRTATLADAGAAQGANTARCLDSIRGATLNVLVPSSELPRNAQHLTASLPLPLP